MQFQLLNHEQIDQKSCYRMTIVLFFEMVLRICRFRWKLNYQLISHSYILCWKDFLLDAVPTSKPCSDDPKSGNCISTVVYILHCWNDTWWKPTQLGYNIMIVWTMSEISRIYTRLRNNNQKQLIKYWASGDFFDPYTSTHQSTINEAKNLLSLIP